MKILITGANGQLGQELIKVLEKFAEIIPTDTHNLDITDAKQVNEFLKKEKPDWIINSAAYTDVEGAAENPEKANLINGEGTKNLAHVAREVNAKLVYISTNEVFSGEKTDSYNEEDETGPLNPYAESKLLGEKYVQEILHTQFLILRTSWLYGPASKINFPNKIISRALETGKLSVVDDEVAVPTYTPDLANWIGELIKQNRVGIFHLVNDGSASRYDWAKQIIEEKKIDVPLERAKLADYPRKSKPPKHSVLSNEKAKNLGLRFRSWQEASNEYLESLSIDFN